MKHYKYYLLCAAIRYGISDDKVSAFAKSFMKRWKVKMESTVERLYEVKEFLESKDEKDGKDELGKKIDKAKESAENINKKETRGFISKKQAKEDLDNLEDRIDELKDKVGKKYK